MLSHGIFVSLLSAFVLVQNVAAIASGLLGIRIHDGLAKGQARRFVFGSIAQINGLSGWSDAQILDLAFVAHDDMLKAYKATDRSAYPGLSTKSPSVTTTMVIGDTAYISSSLTGGGYLYSPVMIKDGDGKAVTRYENIDPKHVCTKPVVDALSRCELRGVNFGGHRNGANCGEAMAALAYCTTNDAATFADGNTKIVSIKGKSPDKYAVIAPCAGPGGLKYQGDWGCHDFTGEVGLGMRVIDPSTTRQSTDVAANDITITYAEYP